MKKLLSVLLILCLVIPSAIAEIDLSGLTFSELVELRDKCLTEMTKRDEWQEVTVPTGVWEIGKDIPAGHWDIRCSKVTANSYAVITYVSELDETKKKASFMATTRYADLIKPEGSRAMTNNIVIDLEMNEGMFLIVERCPVIFTPYTGKPNLGFK